jgi:hypothetical protein
LESALDGLARFVPGEADDAPSRGGEGGVSSAVLFEGGSRAVGLPAVEFDDEVVRRLVEVDLEAWVVGGSEGEVDRGSGRPASLRTSRNQASSLLRVHLGSSREVAWVRAVLPRCPFDLASTSVIARWS